MISKTVAVTPAETADCPRWIRFLDEALARNADNTAFFQRFCGYSLTGLTREEALLFIAGKPGTGKGTATKTVVSIMRDYAMPVPVAMFTDTGWRALEYYRAQFLGKRMIMAAEPEKGAKWSDAFVNEITGGDRITGRHPTGQPFQIDPEFKLVIQGEQVPELKSVATGLRRRLCILPFEVTPPEPDRNLKEALKAEWPSVLRWMIDGCLEWQRRGLDPPADVKNAVEDYFKLQDRMARWTEECCDRVPAHRTKPSALRASFNAWADRNGEERMSFLAFHQALQHLGFKQTTIHGTQYVHMLGLKADKLRDEPDEQ
jgi:putative DNA primase/helicase